MSAEEVRKFNTTCAGKIKSCFLQQCVFFAATPLFFKE
jgi:hypothetical protein